MMSGSTDNNELTSWYDGPAADLHGWYRPGHETEQTLHFLHGNGFCSRTLWPMAQRIPGYAPLLLTDVPGHGFSQQPSHEMPDWLKMARRIGDALESRRGDKPMIGIGHSMGGVLTLLIAAERPQLFSRIILLDPVLFSPEVLLFQRLARKSGLWKRSRLVKSVSARRRSWPDALTMKDTLKRKSLYRHWTGDALDNFILGGTKPAADGIELCCHPEWEASIFGSYPRGLWNAVHRVNIPVDILVARDSYGFIVRAARKASKRNENIRWRAVVGSHCFPMEEPVKAAELLAAILSEEANEGSDRQSA